ncbi:hypothetical protein DVS28_b0583 (plasmid) [Euzebya pacifica]|uniref:Uncharacterized protein n=1 Tax=Euzebya pacifica TaxID=1608957 RepID=A0A346Y776_9ACTN|nr:hypothetical protein DVS28_b0583 [Euzebya pacifica]
MVSPSRSSKLGPAFRTSQAPRAPSQPPLGLTATPAVG